MQEIVTGSFNMKKEAMGHEPERNDWLGTTLRRSDGVPLDACLDAETLAAWADGGLTSQAAAVVESHASSCSRCMAVLAAMERTAPATDARHAWTPARLFRWLVPLTAAATAIAIWVVVPDRPITSSVTRPAENSRAADARVDAPQGTPAQAPQPATQNQNENLNPAPSTQNLEPQAKPDTQAKADSQTKEDLQFRDEARRERAEPEALNAPAAVAEAPSMPPSAPPPAAASPGVAADSRAGASAAAERFALNREIGATASVSPSNPLNSWRVVSSRTIERSTDGGKTWMKTVPLPAASTASPLTILSVRAVDQVRAVARTSEGTEFYTSDGGLTWTRVQENSTAPF